MVAQHTKAPAPVCPDGVWYAGMGMMAWQHGGMVLPASKVPAVWGSSSTCMACIAADLGPCVHVQVPLAVCHILQLHGGQHPGAPETCCSTGARRERSSTVAAATAASPSS